MYTINFNIVFVKVCLRNIPITPVMMVVPYIPDVSEGHDLLDSEFSLYICQGLLTPCKERRGLVCLE